MKTTRLLTGLLLVVLTMLVVAACGGDDDEDSTESAAAPATSAAAPETTAAAETSAEATTAAETTAEETTAEEAETTAAETTAEETTAAESTAVETLPTEAGVAAECMKGQAPTKKDGVLTIGTDKPAFPPYIIDDDPTNGKGFESAVAYAVAISDGMCAGRATLSRQIHHRRISGNPEATCWWF